MLHEAGVVGIQRGGTRRNTRIGSWRVGEEGQGALASCSFAVERYVNFSGNYVQLVPRIPDDHDRHYMRGTPGNDERSREAQEESARLQHVRHMPEYSKEERVVSRCTPMQ
jgi:hypothetical protein